MTPVPHAIALPGLGLDGDRYATGVGSFSQSPADNELTLIEAETLDLIVADHGLNLEPGETRRNIVTRGIDLNSLVGLNSFFNELAYKPKHGQSYLFYLPWANHDTNSALSAQDGIGPLRQSMLLFTCGTLNLVQGTYVKNPSQNPTLLTLLELLDLPNYSQSCKGNFPK